MAATQSTIRKASDNHPGATVSVDQMISAQTGLIPQISGHLTWAWIWAATISIDHCSDLVHVHLMCDQTQDSTLDAKASFERMANLHNVQVQLYHSDNGQFAEKRFLEEVRHCNHEILFCAVGAHNQNGLIECKIKDLMLITQTLLLHTKRHWPEMITTMLWQQALKAAETHLNHLSMNANGKTLLSQFAQVDCQVSVQDFHTWGCPVFVLNGRLQSDPKGVPKWEPCCRVGIYMGHLPVHTGLVALVLNPTTRHILPQFHVVFDDTFSTVLFMCNQTVPPHWAELVQNSTKLATEENFDRAKTWFQTIDDPTEAAPHDANIITPDDEDAPANEGAVAEANKGASAEMNKGAIAWEVNRDPDNPFDPLQAISKDDSQPWTSQGSKEDNMQAMPKMMNLEKSGLRRLPCLATMRNALTTILGGTLLIASFFTNVPIADGLQDLSLIQKLAHQYHYVNSNFDGTLNGVFNTVFAISANNDCYTYSSMMKQQDRGKFVKAMLKETTVH